MKTILKLFFITLILILTRATWAFIIPADNTFFTPIINTYSKTINEPSSDVDQYQLIQDAIDEVHNNGGGLLTIKGTHSNYIYNVVKSIQLRSNVHIRVTPIVVFKTDKPAKATIFEAGKNGDQRIENFSFQSTKPDRFVHFDFSGRTPGMKEGGAVAISLGAVNNFRVADLMIEDNLTPYSCITVNLLDYVDASGATIYKSAKNGIIENCESNRGHYGYGLIQCQAAKNVLFRKLVGEGGVPLRLETGAIGKANLADNSIRIEGVYGTDITCSNGQAAVTLSPHTVNNGKVFVDDLTAISCEAGAIIAAGFLSKKKGQADANGNAIDGYVYGYFHPQSVVSNIKVIYGTKAQLRPQRRVYVPCSQKSLIGLIRNKDEESYPGPTVAGIVYKAKIGTDRALGYYTVNTPGLEMIDFPEKNGVLENKEWVGDPNIDGYKNCVVASNNDIVNTSEPYAYINPKSKNLEVVTAVGSTIEIFDMLGNAVGDIPMTESVVTSIACNDLRNTFLIVRVINGSSIYSQKVMHRIEDKNPQ